MKNWLYVAIGAVIAMIVILWPKFTESIPEGVPEEYRTQLSKALDESGRSEDILALLESVPEAQQRDLAYLLVNMYEEDLRTMDLELLRENVEYAAMVRTKYEWAKSLPEEVYLQDVLPYHVVDEVRDAWRKELYEMFSPAVDTCKTMYDAICAVNANIPRLTGVDYNTKREKTNR